MRWMLIVSSAMIHHSSILHGEVMDARIDVYSESLCKQLWDSHLSGTDTSRDIISYDLESFFVHLLLPS